MAKATLPAQASGLPAHPNLTYLKKLAKEHLRELRAKGASAKLADAQLTLARQHGFASWPQLKAHIDAATEAAAGTIGDELADKVEAFLTAAVSHHTGERPFMLRRAETLLAEEPRIAGANLLTACVLGNAELAMDFLSRDAKAATRS